MLFVCFMSVNVSLHMFVSVGECLFVCRLLMCLFVYLCVYSLILARTVISREKANTRIPTAIPQGTRMPTSR